MLAGCGADDLGVVAPASREVLASPSSVLVPLPGGGLVVEREGRLLLLDPRRPELEPEVIGPSGAVGAAYAAVPIEGAVLILAEGGTFVLRESAWVPSPLGASLDGPIRAAVTLSRPDGTSAGDLWIATERSLYRVMGERAERLALDGGLGGVQLAAVRRPEGPALWVRLADRVLEVWRDRAGALRTARLALSSVPTAIAGDARGTGWLVLEGRLHSLGGDRRLVDHGVEVDRLLGSPSSHELWALGPEGTWLHADGRLHRALGVDAAAADRLAIGVDGSLYAAGATVRRLAPRRDVELEGPPEGILLVTPRPYVLLLEGAPVVEAFVDGVPVEVSRDPLQVVVEPASLGDGDHELVVRVTYDDGTLPFTTRRRFFVVSNVTWTEHVQPIYDDACASCHGPAGPASSRLDTRADWVRRADEIYTNLVEARMPLGRPPLSANEIAYVEAWMVAGFPE